MLSAKANFASHKFARLATLSKTSTRRFGRLQTLGGKLKHTAALTSPGQLQNGSPKLQKRGLSFCVKFNISKQWAVHITLPCAAFILETCHESFDDALYRPENVVSVPSLSGKGCCCPSSPHRGCGGESAGGH